MLKPFEKSRCNVTHTEPIHGNLFELKFVEESLNDDVRAIEATPDGIKVYLQLTEANIKQSLDACLNKDNLLIEELNLLSRTGEVLYSIDFDGWTFKVQTFNLKMRYDVDCLAEVTMLITP